LIRRDEYQGRLYGVPFTSNAGLLYYRKDVLAAAHRAPPRTVAELASTARTVAPKYGLAGYAGQFAPYEGLTVNFAEAVQSAGEASCLPVEQGGLSETLQRVLLRVSI